METGIKTGKINLERRLAKSIYTLDVQITSIGQPQGIAPTGAIVGATLVVAPF